MRANEHFFARFDATTSRCLCGEFRRGDQYSPDLVKWSGWCPPCPRPRFSEAPPASVPTMHDAPPVTLTTDMASVGRIVILRPSSGAPGNNDPPRPNRAARRSARRGR